MNRDTLAKLFAELKKAQDNVCQHDHVVLATVHATELSKSRKRIFKALGNDLIRDIRNQEYAQGMRRIEDTLWSM